MNKKFSGLNAIKLWAKTNEVKFMDSLMPYVQKDESFYYFGVERGATGDVFILLMTSSKDLQDAG